MKNIYVAKEFSECPFGRYKADGKNSGERFRDDFLLPALTTDEAVCVDFSGIEDGLSSGFLEESFGGLVRVHNLNKKKIIDNISFILDDEEVLQDIYSYILEA